MACVERGRIGADSNLWNRRGAALVALCDWPGEKSWMASRIVTGRFNPVIDFGIRLPRRNPIAAMQPLLSVGFFRSKWNRHARWKLASP
jgi:hypothetical protein